MNAEQAQTLRKAVRQLVRAEIAHSWKGNLIDRDDIALVEEELKSAKSRFGVLLHRFTEDLPAAGTEREPQATPGNSTKDETQS